MKKILTQINISDILDFVEYDEKSPSGLIWVKKPSKRTLLGADAGSLAKDGYWKVMLKKEHYSCHRIIYSIFHKDLSTDMDIDHIDGNRSNNKISNLRIVSHGVNQRNRAKRKTNTSNMTGVYFDEKNQRWRATWRSLDGKWKSKSFNNSLHGSDAHKKAVNARKQAIIELNNLNAGYTARHIYN